MRWKDRAYRWGVKVSGRVAVDVRVIDACPCAAVRGPFGDIPRKLDGVVDRALKAEVGVADEPAKM